MKSLPFVLLMMLTVTLAACGSSRIPIGELSVAATDIAYDTHRFEVLAGQPVKLTLNNKGALVHDFSILEMPHIGEVIAEEMENEVANHDMSHLSVDPEIHVASAMGESHSIEFTPSTPGEYEFFCTVVGHKEAGMVGTLVVKAP